MRRLALLLSVVPLLNGCGDAAPVSPRATPGSEPAATISDGGHGGPLPGFYFLPPLVPRPAYSGVFAADVSPRVEVCALDPSGCVAGEPVAVFTMTSGTGGSLVTVDPVEEQYEVEWHTRRAELDPAADYRLSVWIGTIRIGFADIDVASSGSELKNVDREKYIPLLNGRTLPIHFRIEQALVNLVALADQDLVDGCLTSQSCVVQHISPNDPAGEQVVMTSDGYFASVFPNGFMDSYLSDPLYEDGVTVVIYGRETSTAEPCLPYAGEQADACGRYETIPALERGFDVQVRVEQCLDPAKDIDEFQMHKFSLIGPVAERGRVVPLPRVDATNIDCAGFMAGAPTLAQRLLRELLSPVIWVFAPKVAYATDTEYGGMTTSYSDIGYARPLTLQGVAGDGQSALAGSLLPVNPTVRVLEGIDEPKHPGDPLVPQPATGVQVTFAAGATGGSIGTATVVTDQNGEASTPWTLGSQAGTYTVTASIAGGQSVTFTATASAQLVGPDLTYGFQAGQTYAPFRLLRRQAGTWVEVTGQPPSFMHGDTVKIETYFINSGDTEVSSGFMVRHRLDASQTWTSSSWPLGTLLLTTQGFFSTVHVLVGNTSGCTTRSAEAELDVNNDVPESNSIGGAETNNFATFTYEVCIASLR